MKVQNLLFGAAYYDEYMPCDRIDTDMQYMKEAGMNTIRIAESTWATWEPEDGVYDFSHLHRMLDAATRYNMNVIVGTPTYAIPAWLSLKCPEILALNKGGKELYGPRQRNTLSSPAYRYHAERIIRKLMEEVKDYDCVIGFQLDNETRSCGAADPFTQSLFVQYLKAKYPDINDFNDEFGLNYWSNRIGRWEDFPDVRATINQSLDAAYQAFLRDVITEFFNWQAAIIDEYRRPDQFITHNFDFDWRDYSYALQPEVDQYSSARCMDVAGCDIYHPSGADLTGREIAICGNIARSLKKDNYLILETQAPGRVSWYPYKGQLRLHAYSHLGSGANSLMYWNWHSIHNAIESYWMGILSHNLEKNEVYYELADFKKEFDQIEEHLINLKKTCKVGVIIDNRSLTGIKEFYDELHVDYNDILRSYCDACYDMNLEMDMLSIADDFSQYPLLIVPALYSVTEDTVSRLREYVTDGGHLIMSCRSLYSDEELKIWHENQPYHMTDVFGMTYERFSNHNDINVTIDNKEYSAGIWAEFLHPDKCQVIADYASKYLNSFAAITHNVYGQGTATYIGCALEKEGIKEIIEKVTSVAGISLPDLNYPLIIKEGDNDLKEHITYIYNYSSETASGSCPCDGTDLLTGKAYKKGDTIHFKDWDLMILASYI